MSCFVWSIRGKPRQPSALPTLSRSPVKGHHWHWGSSGAWPSIHCRRWKLVGTILDSWVFSMAMIVPSFFFPVKSCEIYGLYHRTSHITLLINWKSSKVLKLFPPPLGSETRDARDANSTARASFLTTPADSVLVFVHGYNCPIDPWLGGRRDETHSRNGRHKMFVTSGIAILSEMTHEVHQPLECKEGPWMESEASSLIWKPGHCLKSLKSWFHFCPGLGLHALGPADDFGWRVFQFVRFRRIGGFDPSGLVYFLVLGENGSGVRWIPKAQIWACITKHSWTIQVNLVFAILFKIPNRQGSNWQDEL